MLDLRYYFLKKKLADGAPHALSTTLTHALTVALLAGLLTTADHGPRPVIAMSAGS